MLGMKPVFQALGDVPNTLAKLGHLLESGRNSSGFHAGVMSVIDDDFEWVPCDELPAEAEQWHREAKLVLERSRALRDLTEEQECTILVACNGDWKALKLKHWCLRGGRCPLKCIMPKYEKQI